MTGGTPILRDAREIQAELGTDLRGYQRIARMLANEVHDTLTILEARDAGLPPTEIRAALGQLDDGVHKLGAYGAQYQLERIATLFDNDAGGDHWQEIQGLVAELRRLQAALLAA